MALAAGGGHIFMATSVSGAVNDINMNTLTFASSQIASSLSALVNGPAAMSSMAVTLSSELGLPGVVSPPVPSVPMSPLSALPPGAPPPTPDSNEDKTVAIAVAVSLSVTFLLILGAILMSYYYCQKQKNGNQTPPKLVTVGLDDSKNTIADVELVAEGDTASNTSSEDAKGRNADGVKKNDNRADDKIASIKGALFVAPRVGA